MKTIDINTTQNVIIRYPLAGIGDRWGATIIDLILVYFVSILLINIILSAFTTWGATDWPGQVYGIFPLLSFFLYQIVLGAFFAGNTLGRKMMGIKVVNSNGGLVSGVDYTLRTIFYLVDAFFCLGIVGSLLMNITPKSQRLGDLAANTICIKIKSNKIVSLEAINKIGQSKEEEVMYPQVVSLSEKDMLLVKKTIEQYRKYKNQAHKEAVLELTDHLADLLDIQPVPKNKINFLEQLIKEYVISTR